MVHINPENPSNISMTTTTTGVLYDSELKQEIETLGSLRLKDNEAYFPDGAIYTIGGQVFQKVGKNLVLGFNQQGEVVYSYEVNGHLKNKIQPVFEKQNETAGK